jgi:hypothetical protein
MFSFSRATKFGAAALAAAAILAAAATPSRAETCRIRLHIVKAGFIVGVGGGSGTLNCNGHYRRLSVGGIGIGSLGVSAVDLNGTASNVNRPSDVAGTYGAAGAGATFIAGGQVATLQNQNGVILSLGGFQAGFQVSLSLGGMTLALQ